MAAAEFLAKLDGLQGKGPRYRAICPAHTSRNGTRSLSILEADDGRVLITCHAGCGVHEIVSAVGMDLADLFPPRVDDDKRGRRIPRAFLNESIKALGPQLTGAWWLLRRVQRGQAITKSEREAAGRFADNCAELIRRMS